ncbi:hypothetical protein COCON_G00228120 [Conger conger]|uniref:MANSC domain-containing protein n=1 Tax=Conger conger TaxID=82655 RepID=A0A9Q1CUZ6_CONCO|nr:hypothetical protein COCON_G00228120 [Conger conger]
MPCAVIGRLAAALLLLGLVAMAAPAEQCLSKLHVNAIVNVRVALSAKSTVMDSCITPSQQACLHKCCAKDLVPGFQCNMVVYQLNKPLGSDNCYLFHCEREEDCPLVAMDGVNSHFIFTGLDHSDPHYYDNSHCHNHTGNNCGLHYSPKHHQHDATDHLYNIYNIYYNYYNYYNNYYYNYATYYKHHNYHLRATSYYEYHTTNHKHCNTDNFHDTANYVCYTNNSDCSSPNHHANDLEYHKTSHNTSNCSRSLGCLCRLPQSRWSADCPIHLHTRRGHGHCYTQSHNHNPSRPHDDHHSHNNQSGSPPGHSCPRHCQAKHRHQKAEQTQEPLLQACSPRREATSCLYNHHEINHHEINHHDHRTHYEQHNVNHNDRRTHYEQHKVDHNDRTIDYDHHKINHDHHTSAGATFGRAVDPKGVLKTSLAAAVVVGLVFLTLAVTLLGKKALESFNRRHYTRLELNDLQYDV